MNNIQNDLLKKITIRIKEKKLTPDQVKGELKTLFKIDKIALLTNKQLQMYLDYLN